MMRFLILMLFVAGCSAAPYEGVEGAGGAPLGQSVATGSVAATGGTTSTGGDTTASGGASEDSDESTSGGSAGSGGGSGGEPNTACSTPTQLNLPDSFPWSEEASDSLSCNEGWDCNTQAFLYWDEPVQTSADGLEWDIRILRQETTAGYGLMQYETECLGETVEIEASDPTWWNVNYHVVLSDEPGFPLEAIYLKEENGDYNNPETLEEYGLPSWSGDFTCNYTFLTELTIQAIRSASGSCG